MSVVEWIMGALFVFLLILLLYFVADFIVSVMLALSMGG